MGSFLTVGGLVAGVKTASLIQMIPGMLAAPNADGTPGAPTILARLSGGINILLGAFLAAKIKKPALKALFIGYASGGLYNLIATNVPQLNLHDLSGVDVGGVDVGGDQPVVMMGDQPVVMVGEEGSNWGGGNW